ncbi:hypothetical protein JYB55_02385 [Mycolicibacterium septicum]|nr:hypothetical protein [Mycolicibacterium septicum]
MSGQPIHDFLWEVTLPAVRAAWAVGQSYVESGRYVPRFEPVKYTVNDVGWPSTVETERFSVPQTAPVDWTGMFALEPSKYTYVTVADVPELSSALDAVVAAAKSDGVFASGMNSFDFDKDVESRERSLRTDYIVFVASIVARAAATGVTSDADLLQIYLQLERARFSPTLVGDLVIPLTLTSFALDTPIALSESVLIEPLAPEFQCARAPSLRFSDGINPFLVAAATHAIVVRGIPISNQPYAQRIFSRLGGRDSVVSDNFDRVDAAIQCIHIVTERPVGAHQFLVRPHGWADRWKFDLPPVWTVETVDRYPKTATLAPWLEAPKAIEPTDIDRIAAAYAALSPAPNDVKLAARRSVRAMMRTDDEDRTLDATIGIEALLLDDSAELKYRMAMRAAAALCDEYKPDAIFDLTRKIYDHRSAIAHGKVNTKPSFTLNGHTVNSADMAPFLLRALLRSRLLSQKPWSKKDLESRIMTALGNYGDRSAE